MTDRRDCCGTMLPDLCWLDFNRLLAGKAFQVLIESHGIGVAARQVKVKPDAWDAFAAFGHCRDCYELSMTKLALATALVVNREVKVAGKVPSADEIAKWLT